MLTEWDSEHRGTNTHLRSIYRDGWLCTCYEKGSFYDGSEGELYNLESDPYQWNNLWDDANHRRLRDELSADLYAHLPPAREPKLPVEALV